MANLMSAIKYLGNKWMERIKLIDHVCNKIIYKRDVRSKDCQRLSSLWKSVEFFRTTFLEVKLQRLCKSHHLCITPSKDWEKLENSLCVRDEGEDLCWMASGPQMTLHHSQAWFPLWLRITQKLLSVNTPWFTFKIYDSNLCLTCAWRGKQVPRIV